MAKPGGLANNQVLGLLAAHDGSLWVGMDFGGGLFHLKNGTWSHYDEAQGLTDPAVAVIQEDGQGRLWLGTRSALVRFQDGKFTRYTTAEGLAANKVKAIIESHDGVLWIGTTNGLSRWQSNQFTSFTKRDGLSDNRVNALFEDRQDCLWVGTEAGLSRFQNGRFSTYTTSHGLFDDAIFEIVDDRRGHLWLTCPKGIFRVGKRDFEELDGGKTTRLQCVSFGKADGLTSQQCHGTAKPGGWLAHGGRLWFTTVTGLVTAEPNIEVNNTPPPVVIEEVIADKQVQSSIFNVQTADARMQHPTSILEPGTLNLPPGQGELELHYNALSFLWPEKNRFKYWLEGADTGWVDAGTRRVSHYFNLRPGNYRFRVIACNNDGVWNEQGAELKITLQPHYWQTWWFGAGSVLAGILTVGGTARVVTKKRMQRQVERLEQQHALEKERSRIAQDMHDDLGLRLTEILLASDLASNSQRIPQDIKAHVGKISHTAREVIDNLDAIVWAVNPKNDSLDVLVGYVCEYVESILTATSIRCRIDVPVDLPAVPLTSEVRHNVFMIVKESLHNIIKHAEASEVWLRVQVEDGRFTLSLEDNGKGFFAASVSRFGNGLQNMKKRMASIGGTFDLTTALGAGTKIRLSVPV